MVRQRASLKCTSCYANEKKQIADFSLKDVELNKQWICFVNRRYWLATKHSVLSELGFK